MSRHVLPPEHIAYMQVFAQTPIKPHSVIYPTGELTQEDIPIVSGLVQPDTKCAVGVADSYIEKDERGTIVVAGIVTLYSPKFNLTGSENKRLQLGQVVFASDVYSPTANTLPSDSDASSFSGFVPVGTLLAANVPGIMNEADGKYLSGARIFLCPWMSAFSIPRKLSLPEDTTVDSTEISNDPEPEWETIYDSDGTPKQKRRRTVVTEETREMPAPESEEQIDLRRALGSSAIEAMIERAASTDGEMTEEEKKEVEEGLNVIATIGLKKMKADSEALRSCFIQ